MLAWGWNWNGQLGLGSTAQQTTPQPVPAAQLNQVTAVACGTGFSLALRADGTVWAWGCNYAGQLGLGHTQDRHVPTQIPTAFLNDVSAIAAGGQFAMALLNDGSLRTWGANWFGQLGLGDLIPRLVPTSIPSATLSGAVAIDAGCNHGAALLADGSLRVWGSNLWAQLGQGNYTDQLSPVVLTLAAGATAASIKAGEFHTQAMAQDHTIFSTGINSAAQLGLGNTSPVVIPTALSGSSALNAVLFLGGESHTLGLTADGRLLGWGGNWHGQLGIGDTLLRTTPTLVPASLIQDILILATGHSHGLALAADGALRAWGANYNGQLGTGDTSNRVVPTVIIPNFAPPQFTLRVLTSPSLIRVQRKYGPPFHWAFNVFTLESQSAPSPGAIPWLGLLAQPAEVFAWQNFALAGHPLAAAVLDAAGFSEYALGLDPGVLAGITVHGKAWAIEVLAGAIAAASPVMTVTF